MATDKTPLTLIGHTAVALPFALLILLAPALEASARAASQPPFTDQKIEQRGKLLVLVFRKKLSRDEIIEALASGRRKIEVAKRCGLSVTDRDVDAAYAEMDGRMRLTPEQFTQVLIQLDVDPVEMKDYIKAEISGAVVDRALAGTTARTGDWPESENKGSKE